MSSQKLNQRQAKWTLYLSRFDFTLKHIPESSIGRADSLSKHPDWQVGIERDNKNRVLVKKEQLKVRAIQVIKVVIKGIDLLKKIRKSEAKDNKIVKAIEEIKQTDIIQYQKNLGIILQQILLQNYCQHKVMTAFQQYMIG